MSSTFSSCLFCLGRLRKGVTACTTCQSSLWRLEQLVRGPRNQTQTRLYTTLLQLSTLQPASRESTQSRQSHIIWRKNNCTSPYVWSEEAACVAMKRKMGQLLTSSSKQLSPTVSPDKRGKKQARTGGQTGSATSSADAWSEPNTEDSDGGERNCLETRDGNKAKKTKLTEPLIQTKESLSSHMHQMFTHIAQKNPAPLRVPHIVTTKQRPLPDLTVSSAALSAATEPSLGQLEWLGYLPVSVPQTQPLPLVPAAMSRGSVSRLSSSLSVLPCRSYHSSSGSATSPLSEASELSLKEKSERSVEEKQDSLTDQNSASVVGQKASPAIENVNWDRSGKEVQQDSVSGRKKQKASSSAKTVTRDRSSRDFQQDSVSVRQKQKASSSAKTVTRDRSSRDFQQDTVSVRQKQKASSSAKTVTRDRSSRDGQKDAVSVRQKQKASSSAETVTKGRSSRDGQKLASSHGMMPEEVSSASTSVSAYKEVNASWQSDFETDTSTESMFSEDYDVRNYRQKLKQLPRQWEFTRYGTVHHPRVASRHGRRRGPVEFSVMTYNVLAQNLLENHPYLYSACTSRWLKWLHRRRLLMAEIACHDPDIVNLQEVNKDHYFDYLKPRLERLGYAGRYQKRRGDKHDGCATLWKKEKFQLLRFTPVDYWRGGLLDRDNIAIIVELQPVRSGRHGTNTGAHSQRRPTEGEEEDKVVVANTHLLFNPRRGDIKLAQLMLLLAELDKHAYLGSSGPSHAAPPAQQRHTTAARHGRYQQDNRGYPQPSTDDEAPAAEPRAMTTRGRYCPIILTGDLNMEPQSDLYKFVVSGQMDYEGLLVREMSGQEEGRYGRGSQLLERNFFSPGYGVTSSCQYHSAVVDRLGDVRGARDSFPPDDDEPRDETSSGSAWQRSRSPNVGRLWHHLNLVSAYRHRIERLGRVPEVTTHHDRGRCTVDYVFYSVESKEVRAHQGEVRLGCVRDGRLKLLARYGLMSARELDAVGAMPNDVLPSDHVCLITKFLLT